MTIRITDNAQYNSVIDNLFSIRRQYQDVMNKLSSQKNINKISDDALGMTRVLGYKQTNQAISQYQSNIDYTTSWLSATEGKLNDATDVLTEARELATAQATGTASADSRKVAAKKVQAIMDEMLSLANSKLGDRYLFAGSRSDVEPFAATEAAAAIDAPVAGKGNTYTGTAAASGVYTGTKNNTYVLKVIDDGSRADATYKISSDGGETWGVLKTDLESNVDLGDGITLNFPDGTFAENDVFYVNASTAGYYKGNGGALSVSINKGASADYNITGEEAFTDEGDGNIDIFKALKSFKDALEGNDVDGISAAIDDMEKAQDQITICTAECGSRTNRMEMATNNLSELKLNMTSLISSIEDADLAELATTFSMKEVALQAAYEVASRVSSNSIISFLT